MKAKKIKRYITLLLLVGVCIGMLPTQSVYATTTDLVMDELENQEPMKGIEENVDFSNEMLEDSIKNLKNSESDNSSIKESDSFLENSNEDGEHTSLENIDTQTNEEIMVNYVYIENPVVETSEIQRIVFSLNHEVRNEETITINIQDKFGQIEEWQLTKNLGKLYLFEKAYNLYEGSNYYFVKNIVIKNEYEEKIIDLKANNITAEFGVNESYAGINELKPIDGEINQTGSEVQDIETSVVAIDESGVSEAKDDIASVLDKISKESTDDNTEKKSFMGFFRNSKKKNNEIVVALDAGHDANDAGAHANGLKEEELTLKIANYCKEELEKYEGVSVYMTRTGPECPYNLPGIKCMEKRIEAATNAGAKLFVSFHLNSSVSPSANGAEIIIPNLNWKPEVGNDGKALAEKIMEELVELGLNRRPIYSKDTTINEQYQDGSKSDYFTVQICCKEKGIPGLIVEHAFISNSGDANKYLKTEAGLKSLGVADATGIAKHLGLAKWGDKIPVKDGTYSIDSALSSGMSLRVEGDSQNNGSRTIVSKRSEENSSQRFEIVSTKDGYYNIIAEHSGKALAVVRDASGNSYIEQQSRDSLSDAQKWYFVSAGNGYCYVMSAMNVCMDVYSAVCNEGNLVWAYSSNKSTAQRWRLHLSNYKPIEDGVYTIKSVMNRNMDMTVKDGGIENFTNIELDKMQAISSQKFEISYIEGYYKIISEHSGKSIDVAGAESYGGVNLQQYEWNNSNAQLWKILKAENGTYYIRSKLGTVIGLADEKADSKTNILMQDFLRKNSQKWEIVKCDSKPVADGVYTISNATLPEYVLTSREGNIELNLYDESRKQKYEIKYVNGGYYRINSVENGKSLDVAGGSKNSTANVWEYEWNGTDAQLWKFIQNPDKSYSIKSKLGTYIDITSGIFKAGQNIQMYSFNGSCAQKWMLEKNKQELVPVEIEEGTYTIANLANEKQVLDVFSASNNNGANIQTYEFNNTSAQRFEIFAVGNGYYKIISENSGKALDVAGGSRLEGANVWQYEWNKSDAQLWQFFEGGNGSYYIKSKLGTFLAGGSESGYSGMNVEMVKRQRKNNEKWILKKSTYKPVDDGIYTIRSEGNKELTLDLKNGLKNTSTLEYYNGTPSQRFYIKYIGDGYYKISSCDNEMVLTVENETGENGVNIGKHEWNEKLNTQLWKFIKCDSGYFIRSKIGTTLDVCSGIYSPSIRVWTYTLNGSLAQKWSLQKDFLSANIEEGVYTIQTSLSSEKVLDISAASKDNGANLWIYNNNDTLAQKFNITNIEGDYYKIQNINSKKVLDVCAGLRGAGANVWQYTWNGSDAQLWRFVNAGDGKYYIQSKLGTVLDVTGACVNLGTNVQTYIMNYTDAQKWVMKPEKEELYRIMGASSVAVKQMVDFYKMNARVEYPYSEDREVSSIEKFCEVYKDECEKEGVKTEVAFAQAMLETGFLKFGGDVKKEQYNFAGLGATGNGEEGISFESIRIGIRAQIQHLKAYASKEPLKQDVVDPRFKYVKRGCAEYVQWLGQHENPNGHGWATDKNYGYKIVETYIKPMRKL